MVIHSNCLPQFSKVLKQISGKIKSQLGGKTVKSIQGQYSALPEELCRQFSLAEIKAATNNFHQDMIICRGTYGDPIYRGTIDDGTLPVAVKCFYDFSQEFIRGGGAPEFRNGVQFLCQLRHPNLVSLIGFCDEQNDRILLYEYSGKGTLYNHLYGTAHDPLPWKQRLEVCLGAARGLHYLHTGAKHAVIHRNINSRSILLDNEQASKLSEFRYSLKGPLSMSDALIKIEKQIVGYIASEGYTDPEDVRGQYVTDKSDVYSFGVVLFEGLYGRQEIEMELSEIPIQSPNIYKIFECIQYGTIYDITDPCLKGKIAPECFTKFLQIACSCVGNKENQRPAMVEVEVMLEHALELQNKADSKMKSTFPHAECVSFQSSISYDIPDYAGNVSEGFSYSDTCSAGGYLSDSDSSLCR